jgi:hypothetical protein
VVPKSVEPGDDVVIYIRGYGFFATAKINSGVRRLRDWKNRYGAALRSIKLVNPPISLAAIQRHIPTLTWARYPRGIATPAAAMADRIRELIRARRASAIPDLDDAALEAANLDELRRVAMLSSRRFVTPRDRKTLHRARSAAIRLYVLKRADGKCEACKSAAPFLTPRGQPYLEPHHIDRLADGGPDHPTKVIGLCPNCHRRAHYARDKQSFRQLLLKKLAALEQIYRKR